MAAGTQLKLRFGTMSGEKTMSYNYANEDATTQDVKNLMTTMIANGDIFKYPPLTAISAKISITSEREFDLNE